VSETLLFEAYRWMREHNPLAQSLYQSKASSSRNLTSTPGSTTPAPIG